MIGSEAKKKDIKFDSKIFLHPLKMLNEEVISVTKRVRSSLYVDR